MNAAIISVVIPTHNEAHQLPATLRSIVSTRTTNTAIEIVVVDDASSAGGIADLQSVVPEVPVVIVRFDQPVGICAARNRAAEIAQGEILFVTDAHVRFSPDWDRHLLALIAPERILAATSRDVANSYYRSYGLQLRLPSVNVEANPYPAQGPVQVASHHAMILPRELFNRLGGIDTGMAVYSGEEAEFSVRAWLSGAEIIAAPLIQVTHRFKPPVEQSSILNEIRSYIIHNALRFGLLYLSETAILQMLRYLTLIYPEQIKEALALLEKSDIWTRQQSLQATFVHDFNWFIHKFSLKDQAGRQILGLAPPDSTLPVPVAAVPILTPEPASSLPSITEEKKENTLVVESSSALTAQPSEINESKPLLNQTNIQTLVEAPLPVMLKPPQLGVYTRPDRGLNLTFDLTGEIMSLGRHSDNDLHLNLDIVSRYHAKLYRISETNRDVRYRLVDNNSSNHLRYKGQIIAERILEDGDVIEIGKLEVGAYVVYLSYSGPIWGD